MTVTLNLPDDLAAQLVARPDADEFAAAVLADALNAPDEITDAELQDTVAAIGRGLAEASAGKGRPLEAFIAERMEERRQRDRSGATAAAARGVGEAVKAA